MKDPVFIIGSWIVYNQELIRTQIDAFNIEDIVDFIEKVLQSEMEGQLNYEELVVALDDYRISMIIDFLFEKSSIYGQNSTVH